MKLKEIKLHFRKFDWFLFFLFFLLSCFGLFLIFSTSVYQKNFLYLKKQIFFVFLGIFLAIFVSFIDWRDFRENRFLFYFLYFLCTILLFLLLIFGPTIRGTKTWYHFFVFNFDPLEPLKFSLLFLWAIIFSKNQSEILSLKKILISFLLILPPFILTALQPNIGSFLPIFFSWLIVVFLFSLRPKFLLVIFAIFLLFFFIQWNFLLKPYQKERIISFFFQKNSDSKLSWQQTQSKIAIGSGGIFGKGILKSTQGKLGFLPEAKTDFIFSVFAEEFGFFGVLVLFFLFFLLIKRILDVGLKKNSNFTRILSFAFGAQILSEVFINSAMNLGILPVIGVPFPFLSYGGSNLLLKFAFLGVLESIQTH